MLTGFTIDVYVWVTAQDWAAVADQEREPETAFSIYLEGMEFPPS